VGERDGGEVEVAVVDDQDEVPIDERRWQQLATDALATLGVHGPGEVTLTFVSQTAMAELNHQHMDGDDPTDVLSFPLDGEALLPGPRVDPTPGVPMLLGDVVVCPAVAAANAPDHAGTLEDELALLIVHGLLHLLGMDHADPLERDEMQARERELLATHHGALARDPWTS
jgi:probable rRNA maturation factor